MWASATELERRLECSLDFDLLWVLGIEHRALGVLEKCSTNELYLEPQSIQLNIVSIFSQFLPCQACARHLEHMKMRHIIFLLPRKLYQDTETTHHTNQTLILLPCIFLSPNSSMLNINYNILTVQIPTEGERYIKCLIMILYV